MNERDIRRIMIELFDYYAQQVIARIRIFPSELWVTDDDSGVTDYWEDYKLHVQLEHPSFSREHQEHILRLFCYELVHALPPPILQFLWLETDAYFEFSDEKFPSKNAEPSAVEEALFDRVKSIAVNEG